MGKILSKADIFSKRGLDPKTIQVDDWGGEVLYRPMSMTARREVRKKCSTVVTDENGQSTIELDAEKLEVMCVVCCVIDPADPAQKKLMFQMEDINTLEENMSAGGISTVAQAILRDSGMAGNATFRGEKKAES